ncbi:MAG: hypothetical protein IPN11_03435 [Opitutaceae bacterium]|nr:hypothetical protein [Opitutaceae bacterium]
MFDNAMMTKSSSSRAFSTELLRRLMAPRYYIPLLLCLYVFPINAVARDAEIQSHGIFMEGESIWTAIEHPKGTSRWRVVGDSVGDYKVVEISYAKAQVVLAHHKTKEVITIPVLGLAPQAGPTAKSSLIPVEQLNWAWIRSDANFMREKPESPPHSAIVEWQTASDEFKIALRNFYRQHGWELTRMELRPNGGAHVSISPLHDPSIPLPTKEELDRVKIRAGAPPTQKDPTRSRQPVRPTGG